MKQYKDLYVPPLDKDLKDIQKAYCDTAKKCTLDPICDDCIYAYQNIKQFTEWYNKTKA